MSLLDIVQTIIEISKSREEYSEDVNELVISLDTMSQSLRNIDEKMFYQFIKFINHSLPASLYDSIKTELQESQELITRMPHRPGYFDILKSKIPFSKNWLQEIKEKISKLKSLSQNLQQLLVSHMFKQPEKKQKLPMHQNQDFNLTVVEDHQFTSANSSDNEIEIILELQGDEQIKQSFRRNAINLMETYSIPLDPNETQIEVMKFTRPYYEILKDDISDVQSISREHSQIICQCFPNPSNDDEFQKPMPKADPHKKEIIPSNHKAEKIVEGYTEPSKNELTPDDPLQSEKDVFYTCPEPEDNFHNFVQSVQAPIKKDKSAYTYKFFIKNLGKMGTFLYRDPSSKSEEVANIFIYSIPPFRFRKELGQDLQIMIKKNLLKMTLLEQS